MYLLSFRWSMRPLNTCWLENRQFFSLHTFLPHLGTNSTAFMVFLWNKSPFLYRTYILHYNEQTYIFWDALWLVFLSRALPSEEQSRTAWSRQWACWSDPQPLCFCVPAAHTGAGHDGVQEEPPSLPAGQASHQLHGCQTVSTAAPWWPNPPSLPSPPIDRKTFIGLSPH